MSWLALYDGGEYGCNVNVMIDGKRYLAPDTLGPNNKLKPEFVNPTFAVIRYDYEAHATPTFDSKVYDISDLQFIFKRNGKWCDYQMTIIQPCSGRPYMDRDNERYDHIVDALLAFDSDAHLQVFADLH